MSNTLNYVFEKHRISFLKLHKMLQDKKPILLFDIQEQRIYAYPYHEFKSKMSSRSQTVLEEQYRHVLAGTHVVAFARDNDKGRLASTLIEINPDEFEQIDTNEIAQIPLNNMGLKIDNYIQATELVNKMKAALPIPTYLTPKTIIALRKQGFINNRQSLQICDVVYMGDEAGISCQIESLENSAGVFIVSLTHLAVDPIHPLAKEIKTYQVTRKKKLTQANKSQEASSFTIRPRKSSKRKTTNMR